MSVCSGAPTVAPLGAVVGRMPDARRWQNTMAHPPRGECAISRHWPVPTEITGRLL